MGIFSKQTVVEYKILEVEKPKPNLDPEFQKSVPSLAGHPGFIYLREKLRLERSRLEHSLKTARHKDMRDVEFIQSGIFWTNWLDSQLDLEVSKTKVKPSLSPSPTENDAILEASKLLEVVGQ